MCNELNLPELGVWLGDLQDALELEAGLAEDLGYVRWRDRMAELADHAGMWAGRVSAWVLRNAHEAPENEIGSGGRIPPPASRLRRLQRRGPYRPKHHTNPRRDL